MATVGLETPEGEKQWIEWKGTFREMENRSCMEGVESYLV